MVRKLKIDLNELALAFQEGLPEFSHYLDLETGRVLCVDNQLLGEDAEDYSERIEDLDDDLGTLGGHFHKKEPDWIEAARMEAEEIEAGLGTRYIEVAHDDPREAYRDMEAFIATVEDERLQNRLGKAIEGRGAFRRFKDVLEQNFHERQRWFKFQDARVEERLRLWLASEDIAPIEDPEERLRKQQREVEESAGIRGQLIALVLAFVFAARELPGVLRIALIGSLTTEQPDPKDADLIVTVADNIDLSALARLARRLQGRAQGLNRGGDIFLADAQGKYLGRTCPWKECAPGIRQSCNALHCGERQYLHDDLQALTLPQTVLAAPAIDLWPQVVARVPVPADVKVGLIDHLEGKSGL